MTHEMVYFCSPPHWASVFFDQLDTWVSNKLRRNYEYETDAQAYSASLGLQVQIAYCHAEMEDDRKTLACLFSWESERDRDDFFVTIQNRECTESGAGMQPKRCADR